ncbi:MAG: glycoside hydrolase family 18 protein [Bacteroidota bacterium]
MKVFTFCFFVLLATHCGEAGQPSPWITAYYAGWMQGNQWSHYLTPQEIDFSALTHVVHFSLLPRPDGSIDDQSNGLNLENAKALTSAAHGAGKKVLACIGGWNTESGFAGATNRNGRRAFIRNLLDLLQARGYDGVDIDWEPVSTEYADQYVAFITDLREAMQKRDRTMLLTVACMGDPQLYAQIAPFVDQLNIMTYDFSGAWPGWLSWHNAALFAGGKRFPGTGEPLPSVDGRVSLFLAAGIPPEKIGIGIDFYGYVWNGGSGTSTGGVTAPGQSWGSPPWVKDNVPYYLIMDSLYRPEYYHWDTAAQAAYLSIDTEGSDRDKFVSYDNEVSCQAKLTYVVQRQLGGVIIWELGGGWRPSSNPRDPLLKSVKDWLKNRESELSLKGGR